MKLAITVWNGRIAPLFDVAKHVLVISTEGFGKPVTELMTVELHDDNVEQKIAALSAIGVDEVVCGAISREYEEALMTAGIDMNAYVAGDIADVVSAWQEGTLRQRGYSMPGCPCPRYRCMHRGGQQRGYNGLRRGRPHGGGRYDGDGRYDY